MRTAVLFIVYYGCVLYGIKNPKFGLLFFVHITIFRPDALVWGNVVFGRLHLITAFGIIIGLILQQGRVFPGNVNGTFQGTNMQIFVAFVLWLFIVSLNAEVSVQLSLDKSVEVLKVFVLCALFAKIVQAEVQLQAYVWVVAVSFGLLSLWGVIQGMAGNPRLDTLWPGGSNYIGAQLALVGPLVFAKALENTLSLQRRLIFYACFVAIVLCCIYTDSRGAFLGMSSGMLVLVLGTRRRVKILAMCTLLAITMYPWIPREYQQRVQSIFVEQDERDESAASRNILWHIAWRIWQDHPIAGVGLDNFSPVKETYADRVNDIVTSEEMFRLIFNQQRNPHGLYPGMMVETGVIGTAIFLSLLLRNVLCRFPRVSSHGLYFQARAAQAGLIGFAIAAAFGDFQYIEMLYLQLFFVGAVKVYSRRVSDVQAEVVPVISDRFATVKTNTAF